MPGYRSRTEALGILAKVDPVAALKPVRDRLEHGSTAERQGAMAILAAMPGEPARDELSSWVDRLIAGKVAPEIQLDVIEAAKKRPETDFQQKIDHYRIVQAQRRSAGPLSRSLDWRRRSAGHDRIHDQGRARVRALPQSQGLRRASPSGAKSAPICPASAIASPARIYSNRSSIPTN